MGAQQWYEHEREPSSLTSREGNSGTWRRAARAAPGGARRGWD
ncbi:hypothetical protein MANAM107_13210 [Actinomyces capricornis]|uniref:Uncharacterized protein n=1 Tax=Actinomyces capricornis TaxID=2755559 RepID=A0ABN6K4C6_9ACTO|nr:hypothetical protein MANAM107_13210 [Actinomyces capricornis]